jgi:hypothetical protein
MKPLFFTFLLCVSQQSYAQDSTAYLRWVGDISFDTEKDDKKFELCAENNIYQYFNMSDGVQYEGEKYAIEQAFRQNYKPALAKKESGMLRIRFVVNCKGKTDRFRMMGADENYQAKIFDPSIADQLLQITKKLDKWKPKKLKEQSVDYYQYLIFKIENGVLIEILP